MSRYLPKHLNGESRRSVETPETPRKTARETAKKAERVTDIKAKLKAACEPLRKAVRKTEDKASDASDGAAPAANAEKKPKTDPKNFFGASRKKSEEKSALTTACEIGGFDNENPGSSEKTDYPKEIYLYLQTVLESIITAFLILTFVLSISLVIGSSMEPTLSENDRVIIYRLFYKPNYGDIIAVWAEGLPNRETGETGEMIVKRVIGLEGDRIYIDEEGVVYRNGKPLYENYAKELISAENLGNAEYPVTVPENSVFVLGDNRNHSTDSRYVKDEDADYYVGCIDVRYIMGKAVFRIYPFDRIGVLR